VSRRLADELGAILEACDVMRRADEQRQKQLGRRLIAPQDRLRRWVDGDRGLDRIEVVQRAVVHQRLDGHVPDQGTAGEHTQPACVGDRADRRGANA